MDSVLHGEATKTFLQLSGFETVPEADAAKAIALLREKTVHTLIVRTDRADVIELIMAARDAGVRILLTRYGQDPHLAVGGVKTELLNQGSDWEKRLLLLFPKQH